MNEVSLLHRVEYYNENGREPILEFLQSLSDKEQAKILREIDLLEEFGLALGMPHIRKMRGTQDLWELRVKHSSNQFRIFFFYFVDGQFVLLHGIRKKSDKTPMRDLRLAEARRQRYLEGRTL